MRGWVWMGIEGVERVGHTRASAVSYLYGAVLRALSGSDIHVPRLFLTCMELGLWGTRIEW